MPILSVDHVTTYRYRQPVGFGEHRILFRPRDSWDQRLIAASLAITPEPQSLHWIHDVFGNCVAVARFRGRADELRFACRITLEHTPEPPSPFALAPRAARHPFAYDRRRDARPRPLHRAPASGPEPRRRVLGAALPRSRRHRRYPRAPRRHDDGPCTATSPTRRGIEKGVQEPAETLRLRRGTCRDFALLMIEAVRALGFAARFVSGYIYVPERDGIAAHLGGGSTHAWVQVYLPGRAGSCSTRPTASSATAT